MTNTAFSKPEDYVYASTRIRSFEKRLLSKSEIGQFLQAQSLEEVQRLLRDSPYGDRLDAKNVSFADSLNAEGRRLRLELSDVAKGSPLLELLSLENIYHNLKVLFKMHVLGQDIAHLLVEVKGQQLEWLKSLLLKQNENLLLTNEERAINLALKDYEEHRNPERIEVVFDRLLYEEMLTKAKELESELILDWLTEQIDFINVLIFLRMKRMRKSAEWFEFAFIPGGTLDKEILVSSYKAPELPTGKVLETFGVSDALSSAWQQALDEEDISILEKAKDLQNLFWADKGKRYTYGPEVIFAYYMNRTMEIQNLRTLLIAHQSGLSAEQRSKRLRVLN